jgi:phosphate/sulfate permease
MELFLFALILLAAAAVFDLMVGVSNDAVNFLNSPIGSRVAPRAAILAVASLGILAGVSFSGGMMEVARKGIFHPQLFTMPELIMLFLAVMLADVILLDAFNASGLPTSTTVSIVFELLGAAVAMSIIKIVQTGDSLTRLKEYINTDKAMLIIFGILLSVMVAFALGALAQILSRLLFTFDYVKRLRRYGAVWGGMALASITYFILVKGSKGATFMSSATVDWIQTHTIEILLIIFVASAVLLQGLLLLRVNILKPVILVGTFALAMAFAANDLVNFIGVPMAGYHAYRTAAATDAPLSASMEALGGKVPSEAYLLLLAGGIMVVTLWLSRRARTVTETEVSLAHQLEREERFEATALSRAVVRMARGLFGGAQRMLPLGLRDWLDRRLDPAVHAETEEDQRPSFDMLRASVNLMVASAVISYATSKKLPLSTTYVTFMTAMGSSFADRAWGRDSAVYRVTGVMTVIGGWFLTAFVAFVVAGAFAGILYYLQLYGVLILLAVVGLVLRHNHGRHSRRVKSTEADEVFNLKKVADPGEVVAATFLHMSHLLQEIRLSLDATLDALFAEDEAVLAVERQRVKKVQRWTGIITANVFKALRLLQRQSVDVTHRYAETTRRLQKIADGHRDIVLRAYLHVSNHHKGLLDVQVDELKECQRLLHDILLDVESGFKKQKTASVAEAADRHRELHRLSERLNKGQIARIRDDSSKTRLSIMFYAIIGNMLMLSKQNLRLVEAFEETFGSAGEVYEFDLD